MDKKDRTFISYYKTLNDENRKVRTKISSELLKKYFEIADKELNIELPKSNNISKQQSSRNIYEAYQNDKLVLVIGAGASIEFGVPNWNDLLQKIMVQTIQKDNDVSEVLSSMFNKIFSPNPLISGRYLQSYFENRKESFESVVKEKLYSGVDKNRDSILFNEIVKLCVAPGKSPNLDSIISYNFDDILEFKLENTNLDIPYKSVYGVGTDIKVDELPIYHVHGFLPENKKNKITDSITFGENNYHQQYSDLYSWNNIVQINKFRDNTCLFIGSSLSDPNIRRLLDISLKQKGNKRKHHYIFKKRVSTDFLKKRIKNLLENSEILNQKNSTNLNFDETLKLLRDVHERFEENDSASLGVQTIWIEDWADIPTFLKKMRENVT